PQDTVRQGANCRGKGREVGVCVVGSEKLIGSRQQGEEEGEVQDISSCGDRTQEEQRDDRHSQPRYPGVATPSSVRYPPSERGKYRDGEGLNRQEESARQRVNPLDHLEVEREHYQDAVA